jgi:hypothetical protein
MGVGYETFFLVVCPAWHDDLEVKRLYLLGMENS